MARLPYLTGLRQRGAISILAAASLTAVIASALLAVDLGSVFYTKRQLQNVADNAALSAVNDIPASHAIAIETAGLNSFPVPGGNGNALTTVPGRYDDNANLFSAGGDPAEQNAVQVTVTTRQPYFFMLGNREITATATATRTDLAGLSIGTGLISIDTEQSVLLNALLGGLLHTSLSLDAVSYQGLINANVRLIDLVRADASIGTVQELLDADLSVGQLLQLTATALDQTDLVRVDASLLNTLNQLALQVPSDLTLKLGDLLDISLDSPDAAAMAQVNVLQLIALSAEVANGEHFLDVPMLGINLPGLVTLNMALSLIEPPSIAIGPPGLDSNGEPRTRAHTAQARLKLDLVVGELLGGLLRVPLYLELAPGDAWLKDIQCRAPRDDSAVTIAARSGLARVYLGNVNADVMTNREAAATVTPATILNVLGLVTIDAQVGLDLPGGAGDLVFNGPFDANNVQRISGLALAGLGESLTNKINEDPNLVFDIRLLGIGLNLGGVLSPLLALLNPVLALLDSLLAPVLSLLGIQLGYADVTAFSLTCGAPRLVR